MVKTSNLSHGSTLSASVSIKDGNKKKSSSTGDYGEFIPKIIKRNGNKVPFEFQKIVNVIKKAMDAVGEGSKIEAQLVAHKVVGDLVRTVRKHKNFLPTVEGIQDEVERQLILSDYVATAKAYILYRAERTQIRESEGVVTDELKKTVKESSKYFKTSYQEFIFYQFYSRWRDDLGRRETWIETVDRYFDFMRERMGGKLNESEYKELRESVLKQEICPSMRLLWSAGKACRATDVCAYNCAYIAPTKWQDLAEIMYVSMCGAGCGFAVEPENVEKFPQIKKQTGQKAKTIVVEDSKEGWCNSFVKACDIWASGKDVDIDYSKIRPAGARLETMGGRASGPAPLQDLMQFTKKKILARQGRRLTTLNLHDIICQIGLIVVAGGVRRSALISLSALDDADIRDAKKGAFWQTEGQRSMANNSAVYEARPTAMEWLEEWSALVSSGSGERGIFNRGALENQVPERRWKKIKDKSQVGVNPCVTADTWVTTSNGARQVRDLICRPFTAIVDGSAFESPKGFFTTGKKQVFEVKTESGFIFKATNNHKVLTQSSNTRSKQGRVWKRVDELNKNDFVVLHNHRGISWGGFGNRKEGWLMGSLLGDGNIQKDKKANLDYWGINKEYLMQYAVSLVHETVGARADLVGHVSKSGYARLQSVNLAVFAENMGVVHNHKVVTDKIEMSSSDFIEGFLQGWFDADGSVQGSQGKGVSIRLASSSLPCLKKAQRMLARLGIVSVVYENRRNAGMRMLPNGKGGTKLYSCRANHELIIANDNIYTFAMRIGFIDPDKRARLIKLLSSYKRNPNRESFVSKVASVTDSGFEEVYDCTVPGPHAFDGNGVYLHNCGEIYLRSKQFCNLTSIVVRPNDDIVNLKRKVRLATILGTYQATLTNFGYLSKEWKSNCEDEQLLGVSITGYYDNKLIRTEKVLSSLREESKKANEKYAKRFKTNQSTAITCIKPHGNSGQLLGVGSGMHPWFARHFIRRVRISANDPLLKFAEDQGVPAHPEVGYSNANATTKVLEFPVKAPNGAIVAKDVSALEMLEEWKKIKVYFTDHNPSVTIYVSDDEWLAVANFVYENWDIVGGLSFLPRNDTIYQLAPYEEIDKDEYKRRLDNLGDLDFSRLVLYEQEDNTTGAKELACSGGTCEI